jgi:hypothetical protein
LECRKQRLDISKKDLARLCSTATAAGRIQLLE